jgi:hypothetical protein
MTKLGGVGPVDNSPGYTGSVKYGIPKKKLLAEPGKAGGQSDNLAVIHYFNNKLPPFLSHLYSPPSLISKK